MAGEICINYSANDLKQKVCGYLAISEESLPFSNQLFWFDEGSKVSLAEIRELKQALALKADSRAVVFCTAEGMSNACQNALLKPLEDREDVLFIFSCSDGGVMLPTIESRCRRFVRQVLDFQTFCDACAEQNAEGWYAFCDASLEVYQSCREDPIIRKTITSFCGIDALRDTRKLLEVFGLLKEKDREAFPDSHKDWIYNAILLLEAKSLERIEEKQAVRIINEIERHKVLCRSSSSYGGNDFIELLLAIATLI